jgi:xanthine/uracil/vitamin C permease (AzgA family)
MTPVYRVSSYPIDQDCLMPVQSRLTLSIVLRLDLITATCAVAGMACILFGTLTNLPVCLA